MLLDIKKIKFLAHSKLNNWKSEGEDNLRILMEGFEKTRKKPFFSKSSKNEQEELEFFLKIIEGHRKCGENCVHLKRFYEKMGWGMREPWKLEIKPKKTVIDTLPLLRKRKL